TSTICQVWARKRKNKINPLTVNKKNNFHFPDQAQNSILFHKTPTFHPFSPEEHRRGNPAVPLISFSGRLECVLYPFRLG
ncbi:MAG: hypothetical protein M0Z37_03720, partial [Nitrospiraceae bacterium]|nr:hypothetical protein [Nitrospiraceae bacterium]